MSGTRTRSQDPVNAEATPTRLRSQVFHITSTTPTKARTPKTPRHTRRNELAVKQTSPSKASLSKRRVNLPIAHVEEDAASDDNEESAEEEEEEEEEEEDEDDEDIATPARGRKGKGLNFDEEPLSEGFVAQTAFDAYFAHASRPSRTSGNVFSSLLPHLTREEYKDLLKAVPNAHETKMAQLEAAHRSEFPMYAIELRQGFNLLFYGFGSKQTTLNAFAEEVCSKRGHVIIVNGFLPSSNIKNVLASIEQNVPGLAEAPAGTSLAAKIYTFFLDSSRAPLFLIIHNIDSPTLRTAKAKAALSLLALHPRIHVVASIDHWNAPLLFTTSECSTRKHTISSPDDGIPPSRGFAWVWHDLTSFRSYDVELAHRDPTVLNSSSKTGSSSAAAAAITESAAMHVLAAVTERAKKLFVLMAKRQLAAVEDGGTSRLQEYALQYDLLFGAAREDFIATSDTALRALLGEFRDHNLVLSSGSGGSEALWIPLPKVILQRIVETIQKELM